MVDPPVRLVAVLLVELLCVEGVVVEGGVGRVHAQGSGGACTGARAGGRRWRLERGDVGGSCALLCLPGDLSRPPCSSDTGCSVGAGSPLPAEGAGGDLYALLAVDLVDGAAGGHLGVPSSAAGPRSSGGGSRQCSSGGLHPELLRPGRQDRSEHGAARKRERENCSQRRCVCVSMRDHLCYAPCLSGSPELGDSLDGDDRAHPSELAIGDF